MPRGFEGTLRVQCLVSPPSQRRLSDLQVYLDFPTGVLYLIGPPARGEALSTLASFKARHRRSASSLIAGDSA
jgi:hypothetical protein